jgi:hypothetical protein
LKRIFSKTSTHRQTQLVALVYQVLASDLAMTNEQGRSARQARAANRSPPPRRLGAASGASSTLRNDGATHGA